MTLIERLEKAEQGGRGYGVASAAGRHFVVSPSGTIVGGSYRSAYDAWRALGHSPAIALLKAKEGLDVVPPADGGVDG